MSLKKIQKPSPKHKKINNIIRNLINGASSFTFLNKFVSAGMTVEASIVLPLFMFFFMNLGCAMEMIRLHGNLQLALWNVGNKMCVYGHIVGGGGQSDVSDDGDDKGKWWDELGDIALSYTYVKSQAVEFAGEDYLEASPLKQGISGIQFWESDLYQKAESNAGGDVIDIVMTYQVAPWAEIPFVKPFRMCNRYYGRVWNGYDVESNAPKKDEDEDMVYIAENASVYHETKDCTHLKLTIREVTLSELKYENNENGGSYSECRKCRGSYVGVKVYIARYGDSYHYDRNCSGLKRTIYTIPRKEAVLKYAPCSRCASIR